MRTLILLVLLATPSLCLSSSLEEAFFIGVSSHGQLSWFGVRDGYVEGPLPFSALIDPTLRYCGNSEGFFQCAKTPTGKPIVIYKSGDYQRDNDHPTKGSGIRYKEAMSYLKKAMASLEMRVEFYGYYICEKGCDDKKPLFIFEFERWGEMP